MHSLAPTTPTLRRYDLDWLRVGAFALLIAYHIGMFYVSWDWHIKSRFSSEAIEPLMWLVNPWRLPLLFLISGMALRFALERTPAARLRRQRLCRLGLPLLFGFFVVCAPQSYFELLANGEIGPDYWAFYGQYLDVDFEYSILTPSWNHLWYLVYLLVYTILICTCADPLGRLADRLDRQGGAWWGSVLLLVPPVLFVLADAILAEQFPVTHALVDDWYTHAISFSAMLFGYLVARATPFWSAVNRGTSLAGAVAIVFAAALLLRFVPDPAVGALRLVYGWCTIVLLLGIASRYLNRWNPILSYLVTATLPYYVLHQTLIVVLGAWATTLNLPLWSEVWVVTIGTITGCVAGYEIIRRVPPLGPLFGVPAHRRARATAPTPLPKAS